LRLHPGALYGIKPANLSVPARWNGRSGRSQS
jgi:hypothetical protein